MTRHQEKDEIHCNVKAIRLTRGLSQKELAERTGIGRQAVYDMESGRYVPNTVVALRLARVLECAVEDLFRMEDGSGEHAVTLTEGTGRPGTRLSVVRIDDRLVAYPQDGRWLIQEGFQSADGLLQGVGHRVRLLHDERQLERRILLLGCDPAFSILHAHINRNGKGAELLCRFASSQRALTGLHDGQAHMAAIHLHNSGPGEANLQQAKCMLGHTKTMVIGFSLIEEGLIVAAGNPRGIRSAADLIREDVRFVNRDQGAALRVLLDDQLSRLGIPSERIVGYDRTVSSHMEGARMVAFGLADAALGLRAIAASLDLDFVPMQFVRCDLIIPEQYHHHPTVSVLLDVLQTKALREDVAALPGYESSAMGTVIGQW